MQIGTNLPRGKGMIGRRWSSKVKVIGGRGYIWKPGGDIILDPLGRVDRGMQ